MRGSNLLDLHAKGGGAALGPLLKSQHRGAKGGGGPDPSPLPGSATGVGLIYVIYVCSVGPTYVNPHKS